MNRTQVTQLTVTKIMLDSFVNQFSTG